MSSEAVSSIIEDQIIPKTPDQLPPDVLQDILTPPETLDPPPGKERLPLAEPENYAKVVNMFIDMYKDPVNSSCVLIAETGAGKTTVGMTMLRNVAVTMADQADQARHYNLIPEPPKNPNRVDLVGTQPRRVAAVRTAEQIAHLAGTTVGEKVGYHIGGEKKYSPETDTLLVTEGLILNKWKNDRLLRDYKVVMIDEAHEGNTDTALALGCLKITNRERLAAGMEPIRIVVTSATINKKKFTEYLSNEKTGWGPLARKKPVQSIEIEGRSMKIDIKHIDSAEDIAKAKQDYTQLAAEKTVTALERILSRPLTPKRSTYGNLQVFMPGKGEVDNTIRHLNAMLEQKYGKNFADKYEVLPLHSEQSAEEQAKIFDKNGKIKIIVCTNIGETSITPDALEYVCDSGYIRQKQVDPHTGHERLVLMKHSQSGLRQRAGRTGRVRDGEVDRLYTKEDFDKRDQFSTPEILRTDLAKTIIKMKSLGIDDIEAFEFIDPPKIEDIRQNIRRLTILGALDEKGKLTRVGQIMERIDETPENIRIILEAEKHGCIDDAITAIAASGEKSLYKYIPKKKNETESQKKERELNQRLINAAHSGLIDRSSDYISAIKTWNAYAASGYSQQWAQEHFLNNEVLDEIRNERFKLMRSLRETGIAVKNTNEYRALSPLPTDTPQKREEKAVQQREILGKCITSGLLTTLMMPGEDGKFSRLYYDAPAESKQIRVNPSSRANIGRTGLPYQHFLGGKIDTFYADRSDTSKVDVSVKFAHIIKPQWIAAVAPHLCEDRLSDWYDPMVDKVRRTRDKILKVNGQVLTVGPEETLTKIEAENSARAFARAMAQGQAKHSATKKNKNVLDHLNNLLEKFFS